VPRGDVTSSVARRGAPNQESAPREASRRIQEKLMEGGYFTIVEDWTRPDQSGIQVMTLLYDENHRNGFQEALEKLLELGFKEAVSDKPYRRRTSTQVYLTAGWRSQIGLHKVSGRPWIEVDFFDANPVLLLSGRDLGPWGTVKRKGLLTFWKEDSDAW
jgi:hypothetical protein